MRPRWLKVDQHRAQIIELVRLVLCCRVETLSGRVQHGRWNNSALSPTCMLQLLLTMFWVKNHSNPKALLTYTCKKQLQLTRFQQKVLKSGKANQKLTHVNYKHCNSRTECQKNITSQKHLFRREQIVSTSLTTKAQDRNLPSAALGPTKFCFGIS